MGRYSKIFALASFALCSLQTYAGGTNHLLCGDKNDLLAADSNGCFYYEEMCYQGDQQAISERVWDGAVWVDDESQLEDVVFEKGRIILLIFDAFTFFDQDADEENRAAFIESYVIDECKQK